MPQSSREYHVGGVPCWWGGKSREFSQSSRVVNRIIICLNGLEVQEAELCPITRSLWEKHCLLLAKAFLELHPLSPPGTPSSGQDEYDASGRCKLLPCHGVAEQEHRL